jgi:hypothetical protein
MLRLMGVCWRYAMVSCTLKPMCSGRLFLGGCRAYASGTAKCLPYAPLVAGPPWGALGQQRASGLQQSSYALVTHFCLAGTCNERAFRYILLHTCTLAGAREGGRRTPYSVFSPRSCRPSELMNACHRHHQFSFLS